MGPIGLIMLMARLEQHGSLRNRRSLCWRHHRLPTLYSRVATVQFVNFINQHPHSLVAPSCASDVTDPIVNAVGCATGRRGNPIYRGCAYGYLCTHEWEVELHRCIFYADPTDDLIYSDVLLNGTDILKVSDDGGNLAKPNPDRIQVFPPKHS